MNWIKVRNDLPDVSEVEDLSDILDLEVVEVIGALVLFWSYADKNSADGTLPVKASRIDRKTVPNFTKALLTVGWLEGRDGSYTIPNFDRHNSASAKARALESEAKRLRRVVAAEVDAAGCAEKSAISTDELSDNMSDTRPTICPTRKRREEKKEREQSKQPPNPLAGEWEEEIDSLSQLLPSNCSKWSVSKQKKERIISSAPIINRLGALFGRGEGSRWTVYEVLALYRLKPTPKEVELIEFFYLGATEDDYPRRDLATLLNNWSGELDKARRKQAALQSQGKAKPSSGLNQELIERYYREASSRPEEEKEQLMAKPWEQVPPGDKVRIKEWLNSQQEGRAA